VEAMMSGEASQAENIFSVRPISQITRRSPRDRFRLSQIFGNLILKTFQFLKTKFENSANGQFFKIENAKTFP
jgi:hypothetical protein